MLRSSGFQSIIDRQTIQVKPLSKESEETVTKTILKLKVTITGDSQYFLDSLSKETGIKNISSLFVEEVVWDRIRFPFRDFNGMDFTVSIEDDIKFDARLIQLDVSRKSKNGIDSFVYVLTLEKDDDAQIDTIIANQYVRKLTRDVNDKRVLALLDITMEPVPVEVQKNTNNIMVGE